MSEGTIGGIFGGKIAARLEKQYGQRRSYLWSGIVCTTLGLAAVVGFVIMQPTRVSDYQRLVLEFDEVYFSEGRRSDDLVLTSNGVKYTINHGLWRQQYETDDLLSSLRELKEGTLWVKPDASRFRVVRGLQAGRVFLSPEIGANLDSQNRVGVLWLAVLFLAFGISSIAYSHILAKKGV